MPGLRAEIDAVQLYTPVEITSLLPTDRRRKHEALQLLIKSGIGPKASVYSQTHTGSHENLHFVFKHDCDPQKSLDAVKKIEQELPKYHDKYVKAAFQRAARQLSVTPMISRFLYHLATHDASAPVNEKSKEIDKRVMNFIEYEDEEIILDLRTVCQKGDTAFSDFFDTARIIIEEKVGTAVDERRHDDTLHLAAALSAADLYR